MAMTANRAMKVTAREVTEDDDDSESSDESDEGDSGDDDEDVRVLNHNGKPTIELTYFSKEDFSPSNNKNNALRCQRYRSAKGEEDDDQKLWEQQPRVLTESESEQAFYSVWL